jgi:uncharacterized protein YndB with AHSA1/START domain
MNSDRIEKKILLRAPQSRVWRALTDSSEFGSWFGMKLEGPFVPGETVKGVIAPTTADAEVAKKQEKYAGVRVDLAIQQIEPERLFSFRWHPGAVEPDIDYSVEPTTLVEFELEKVAEGVMLSLTESGFNGIPLSRRAKAFSANEGGWTMVMKLIDQHLRHAN